ncbi:MAG: hypothetical protein PVG81_09245 [Desulfobacterales bacterium]|jgi:hypothetical protein
MDGWVSGKALRKTKVYVKVDERILDGSDFAEQVLGQIQEVYEWKRALQAKGIDAAAVARRFANLLNIDVKLVWSPGKKRLIIKARSLLFQWSFNESGISMSHLARQLDLSAIAISQSVERGKRIASEVNLSLDEIKL